MVDDLNRVKPLVLLSLLSRALSLLLPLALALVEQIGKLRALRLQVTVINTAARVDEHLHDIPVAARDTQKHWCHTVRVWNVERFYDHISVSRLHE